MRPFASSLAISMLFILGATSAGYAAQLYENRDVGHITCSQQFNNCVAFSRRYRPVGAEGQCGVVWKMCLRTGVWDGKDAFAQGGILMSGMIRR